MTAATEFGLDRIGQIAVTVRDLARAKAFYRDTLGMRFLFQVPRMAFFQCGETSLMLGIPEGAQFDHPSSVVYYLVPDITAAHATLVSRGVKFVSPPHVIHRASDHELWMAFFHDPDGNMLALMARKRPASI